MHSRHPWGERVIESELENIFDKTKCSEKNVIRKRLYRTVPFSQVSLQPYGFDILNHLFYDAYLTIALNVVKNQLSRALELEMLDRTELDKQIGNFPWTGEFKDGRLPKQLGKDCKGIGYRKAESFQKFSFPMAACIMESQLTNAKEYEIFSLIARLTELHFHGERNGWTLDMIKRHQKLAWRLNILVEEVQGLALCTISIHKLTSYS